MIAPETAPYESLKSLAKERAMLGSVLSLLGWDQETYMPSAGANARAEQSAMLASLAHERLVSDAFADAISACESDPQLVTEGSPTLACLRELRRDHDKAKRVPTELVAELALVGSQAQEAWKGARANDDFTGFAPWLERVLDLSRNKAECLGVPEGGELYDALLDEYEPRTLAKDIEAVFTPLAARLADLLRDLHASGKKPDMAPLDTEINAAKQHEFGMLVIDAIGFDLDAGRLDTTTHPFCSGLAPGDTRLTTRYHEERFTDALYGTMHEAGHGLYEQGLPKDDHFGMPLGDSISLGIHESQSRLWENFVGRSHEFWQWALPHAQRVMGSGLEKFSIDQMTRAVNTAEPSFIRVEADEATYNQHVMIRFGIERALIRRELDVKDLPGEWNKRYKELLGIDVPDNKRGCLQDVHWAFGLVGYFPTYTLGNLYAAQLWEALGRDITNRDELMSRGEFIPIRDWLRQHVHTHGRRYSAGELCQMITGAPLSADPLLRHLESRLRPSYS